MAVNTDYSDYSNYARAAAAASAEKTQGSTIDAVFGDPKDQQVSMDDFLQLMVAQLKNQDFMNPVDDTQYLTQLAQFTTMQQMEEMAYNAKSSFITSLVGKNVVAAKITVSGQLDRTEGIVNRISLVDEQFLIYIGDKAFTLDQIMEIGTASSSGSNPDDKTEGSDKTENSDKTEGSDKTENSDKVENDNQTDNSTQSDNGA
ncbi:flagellar hook capping FlgD N-terminal domain-containing protein [Diplocloster hominis]|uniref:flagellar hook capping FlgD N-terminal domain-containing protein n=1 Tax=Diplocloster hominis TaxID=3079010 RepID=UPI0031BB7687